MEVAQAGPGWNSFFKGFRQTAVSSYDGSNPARGYRADIKSVQPTNEAGGAKSCSQKHLTAASPLCKTQRSEDRSALKLAKCLVR